MTLAERLAAFAADLTFDDLPAAVVSDVKLRALDILGIALAASAHEAGPASRVSELERATLALDTLTDARSLMPLCRG